MKKHSTRIDGALIKDGDIAFIEAPASTRCDGIRQDRLEDFVGNFTREGSLRFSLGYPSTMRQIGIASTGVMPVSTAREDGNEDQFASTCQFAERVQSKNLSNFFSEINHPDIGKPQVFANDSPNMAEILQFCVIRGGKMQQHGNVASTASLRVLGSNSVVFGSAGPGTEYMMFAYGPSRPLKEGTLPHATTNLGTLQCQVRNMTDNNSMLATLDINAGGFSITAIERKLRRLNPGVVLDKKRIGFQLVHQVFGESPGPDEGQYQILGALCGLAVVPMKPKA